MFHHFYYLVKHGETFGETLISFCAILRHFAFHFNSLISLKTPTNTAFSPYSIFLYCGAGGK